MSEIETPEVTDTVETQEPKWFESAGENWTDDLPDGMGEHSHLKKYGSVLEALKGGMNQSSMLGKKVESIPDENSTPEQVAEFYGKLGVPEASDGYELKFDEVPEGVNIDDTSLNSFKDLAKEINLTPSQAQAIAQFQVGMEGNRYTSERENAEASVLSAQAELQEEWKGQKYQENIGRVEQALDFLGVKDEVNEMGLGANPAFLKAVLDKIVPAISKDKLIESSSVDNFATLNDNLIALEDKIHSFQGSNREPAYQQLVAQRGEMLRKMV